MASDRWAVQQYQYSYYPYDPYYSYSHACARNCSYFVTTTLASRYSPRSTEQPPCTPSSRVVSMRWSGDLQKKEKIPFDYQQAVPEKVVIICRNILHFNRIELSYHIRLLSEEWATHTIHKSKDSVPKYTPSTLVGRRTF